MFVLPLTCSVSWVSHPSLCCMRRLSYSISCGAFGSLGNPKGEARCQQSCVVDGIEALTHPGSGDQSLGSKTLIKLNPKSLRQVAQPLSTCCPFWKMILISGNRGILPCRPSGDSASSELCPEVSFHPLRLTESLFCSTSLTSYPAGT